MPDFYPSDRIERPEATIVVLADDPPSGTVVGFDYSALPADAAERVRQAAICIRRVQRDVIVEIGRHLLAAKAALPHGSFTQWAEAELGMSDRSARNYMAAARFVEGKPETISDLPPTLLYALAAPSAPDDVVQQVVDAAERGAALQPVEIEKRLDAAKAEARAPARLLRKNSGLGAKEAKAHAAKLRERERRRQEEADQRRRREDEEREARLRALAAELAPLCRPHAAALRAALHEDRWLFAKLLAEALAEMEA